MHTLDCPREVLDGYLEFIQKTWAPMPFKSSSPLERMKLDLLHAGYGLLGELAEFETAIGHDDEKEEIGDILYYTCQVLLAFRAIRDPNEIDLFDIRLEKPGHLYNDLEECSNAIKKYVIYNQIDKGWEDKIIEKAQSLLRYLPYTLSVPTTLEDLIKENVAKLSKRYPDLKFTTEASYLRADKNDE